MEKINMKKFLITISPLCAILFILIWVSCGLKDVLLSFGAILLIIALIFGVIKWMEFIDKHIKD